MRTTNGSTTRTTAIASPPGVVYAYLADAHNLPSWAPAFAASVRTAGDGWVVTRGGQEFKIEVLVEPTTRTVDIVSAEDHSRGLFTRVLPNGAGSELLFTLFFPRDAPEEAVDQQRLTLDTELSAVRDACA